MLLKTSQPFTFPPKRPFPLFLPPPSFLLQRLQDPNLNPSPNSESAPSPSTSPMGSTMSSLSGANSDGRPKLEDVPESCIAVVLGHFRPPEICRLAGLNRVFRGASSADFIWETKLPSNYAFILQKLLESSEDDHGGWDFGGLGLTKKDIFARLSRPNTFDGGTKEIWLDKNTGGVCLSISSKAMSITGIEDRRYWNHIPSEESRFKTVAYLVQIWWFEVRGELDFKFPEGTYSLFFKLQLGRSSKRFGRRICYLEHVHGWDIGPIRFQLTTSDGQHCLSQCYLDKPGSWVMYHGGDFVVRDPNELTRIKFSATQIDCTHTKGGLSVDSVVIYPKDLAPRTEV